jgi:hypothetical protein
MAHFALAYHFGMLLLWPKMAFLKNQDGLLIEASIACKLDLLREER